MTKPVQPPESYMPGYMEGRAEARDLDNDLLQLARKGYAPAIVYDDEGHWAVSDEAFGAVGEKPGSISVIVDPDLWRDTPEKAMSAFLSWLAEREESDGR